MSASHRPLGQELKIDDLGCLTITQTRLMGLPPHSPPKLPPLAVKLGSPMGRVLP